MKSITVGWFEIPVQDMQRAIRFYEQIFEVKLELQDLGGLQMAWFPWNHESSGAGGSLVHHPEFYEPSTKGALVYFQTENILDELGRVEKAGGKVLQEKTEISPEIGFMALFLDTEGNRLALHSQN